MTNTTLTMETINNASRKELQALAKSYGIKANLSSDAIRASLAELVLATLVPEEENAPTQENVLTDDIGNPIDNIPDDLDAEADAVDAPEFFISQKDGRELVKRIRKASFKATKGDSAGKVIITMKKLSGIIGHIYGNGARVTEELLHQVINQLVKLNYLCFKRYESGALIFYPTVKVRDFK